jgi:hypothetical protein
MKKGCPQPTAIFKYSIILILGVLVVSAVLYGSTLPNLSGGWQGMIVNHRRAGRFEKAAVPIIFTVTEQNGRLIKGRFSFPRGGRKIEKGFAGVISQDNKDIYLACTDESYAFGEMVTPGRISLSFLEGGTSPGAASASIARGKHVFTDKRELLSKGAIGLDGFWRGDEQAVNSRGIARQRLRIICAFPEERGRLLEGTRGWMEGGMRKVRNFSGSAGSGERFYISDHEGGYAVADLLSKEALLAYYLHSGPDAKACAIGLGKGRKGETAAERMLKKRRMPKLAGKWQGTAIAATNAGCSTATSVEYAVKKQKGRAFFGTKTGAGAPEGFYGVIGTDNKSLFIAEEREGYAFGELLPGGNLSIQYVEAGPNAKAVENTLKRIR